MNFDKNIFILMCFLGISVVLNWRKGKTKYFFLVVVTPSHSMNYGKYKIFFGLNYNYNETYYIELTFAD